MEDLRLSILWSVTQFDEAGCSMITVKFNYSSDNFVWENNSFSRWLSGNAMQDSDHHKMFQGPSNEPQDKFSVVRQIQWSKRSLVSL